MLKLECLECIPWEKSLQKNEWWKIVGNKTLTIIYGGDRMGAGSYSQSYYREVVKVEKMQVLISYIVVIYKKCVLKLI